MIHRSTSRCLVIQGLTLFVTVCTIPVSLRAQEEDTTFRPIVRRVPGTRLGRRVYLAAGPQDSLYAADPMGGELWTPGRANNSTRAFRFTALKLPGFPGRVGWMGDSLWVSDLRSSRVIFLTRSLEPIRSADISLPGALGPISGYRLLAILPARRLLVETTADGFAIAIADPRFKSVATDVPGPLVPAGPIGRLPIWIADFQGSILGTVAWISTHHMMAAIHPSGPRAPHGAELVLLPQPFEDQPLFSVDPTGHHMVIVNRNVPEDGASTEARYTVRWLNVEGDTVATHRYAYSPVAIPPVQVRNWARRHAGRVSSDPTEGVRIVMRALFRPRWLPPVSRVLVGSDGTVWIRRESVPGAAFARWEILDRDGSRRATELQSDLSIETVCGRDAWATSLEPGGGKALWHIRLTRTIAGR